MASPAYEQILEIQALDLRIDQLRHRIDTHPARQTIADLDGELATHDDGVAGIEAERHELERRQKRLQDETATLQARRTEIESTLYGGEVTASKELLALQDESASLLDRQRALEDDELEVMEEIEAVAGRLSEAAEARSAIEARRADADGELAAGVAELEAEIAELGTERDPLVDPGSGPDGLAELLGRYQELRPQYDGQPVARLVNNACDGCHIQLSAVAVDQMAKMPEDATVICEECGRLLVR